MAFFDQLAVIIAFVFILDAGVSSVTIFCLAPFGLKFISDLHNKQIIKLLNKLFARDIGETVCQMHFQLPHEFYDEISLYHRYLWVFAHLGTRVISQELIPLFPMGF